MSDIAKNSKLLTGAVAGGVYSITHHLVADNHHQTAVHAQRNFELYKQRFSYDIPWAKDMLLLSDGASTYNSRYFAAACMQEPGPDGVRVVAHCHNEVSELRASDTLAVAHTNTLL